MNIEYKHYKLERVFDLFRIYNKDGQYWGTFNLDAAKGFIDLKCMLRGVK